MMRGIFSVWSLLKILAFVSLVMVTSCEKWTPQADAYYVVDGKRYPLDLLVTYQPPDLQPTGVQLVFTGAPGYNITTSVNNSSGELVEGTYVVTRQNLPLTINGFEINRGDRLPEIQSYYNQSDEGQMTVTISGSTYTLDFSGQIDSHDLQIYYSGLISKQY